MHTKYTADSTTDEGKQYLQRGCDAGDGASCRELGWQSDEAARVPLLARACELGDYDACGEPYSG